MDVKVKVLPRQNGTLALKYTEEREKGRVALLSSGRMRHTSGETPSGASVPAGSASQSQDS